MTTGFGSCSGCGFGCTGVGSVGFAGLASAPGACCDVGFGPDSGLWAFGNVYTGVVGSFRLI